jgi:hypothetical protein
MVAFDDSTDPALAAARNRLAAWVEPLPAGALIDDRSGRTGQNLALAPLWSIINCLRGTVTGRQRLGIYSPFFFGLSFPA